jgi:hypothetical protein
LDVKGYDRVMKRRRTFATISAATIAASLVAAALAAGACNGQVGAGAPVSEDSGNESVDSAPATGTTACVPGQQISCPCADAPPAVQVCSEDGTRYGPCACSEPVDSGGGSSTDAPSDASMRDGTVWWSDAGTCPKVANRCDSTSDAAPDVISDTMLFADCICGPGADQSTCIAGHDMQTYCTAYCVANNPGFEAYTSCRIEGGAGGFGFQCECSHP